MIHRLFVQSRPYRLLFRAAALAFLLLPGRAFSQAPATPLRVGMELAYPPFEMTDPSGKPTGVSVDLAEALGKALGRPVQIENIPFDGLIPSLKTGKIDLIISSMTATPERAKSIDFSDPYLQTGLCILTGSQSPIQSVQDLNAKGRTVVVKKGTTGHLYAAKNLGAAQVLVLDKENACVLEVLQGKADGFIYDQMSTYQNWKRHEAEMRPILAPFQKEAWAIGIRKGNDTLKTSVNDFLTKFRAEGGFDALGEKWLKEQKDAFRALGIPFYF